jgi:outer membrane protein assembly factor BamB
MPLLQDGLFYVSSSNGKLMVFDADNGAGPALSTTYNLFNNAAVGDVAREAAVSGRIYVGTGGARMYAITAPTDPTPLFP